MPPTTTSFDLRDACRQAGCPVCRLALTAVHHYLDSMNYDSVNDPGFARLTLAAHGFCNQHAAQWLQQANVLGTAMLYQRVLDRVTPALATIAYERKDSFLGGLFAPGTHDAPATQALRPYGVCPACLHQAEIERVALATFVDSCDDAALREAYRHSTGLCLPHLLLALDTAGDAATFNWLRDHAVAAQEQLRQQLGEVIRKHDYRFRDEPTGAERGSLQRAVHHVAGEPGMDRLPNKLQTPEEGVGR